MRTPTLMLSILLAIPACGSGQKAPAAATDTATDTATTTESPAERIAGTGPISEEEFKALHDLRTDAPPAPKGTMVDLAGSKAYLSLPEGVTGPVPGIVVIHEWWGLNDHIKHWTDRLAALGYAALAVDLYGGVVATDRDAAMTALKAVKTEEARKVIGDAVAYLAKDPRIQAPKHAVIGWCFGGGWSLQAAIDFPEIDAAVIYYGQLTTDPKELAPIQAEILGIFANADQGIPPAEVDKFEKALGAAGKKATIKRYDADHAFANPSGERYDHADAAAAWEEVVAFLGRTLT